jgi:hypothetical protein
MAAVVVGERGQAKIAGRRSIVMLPIQLSYLVCLLRDGFHHSQFCWYLYVLVKLVLCNLSQQRVFEKSSLPQTAHQKAEWAVSQWIRYSRC